MNYCSKCMDFHENKCPISTGRDKQHPFAGRKGSKFSMMIKERDEFQCVRCEYFKSQGEERYYYTEDLESHHILSWRDYPEEAYNPNNVICVCRQCNLELGNSNKLDFPHTVPAPKKFVL